MEAYSASGRLSAFERALAYQRLRHVVDLFARDSLSIGVLLGYVALKTNEIHNLRAIAQGLLLGETPERIRAELMFAG
jgi:vacuolar-type H+-ATPase subunit C/Vma6